MTHTSQVRLTVFKPKCVEGKSFALNSQGYLLPCCWTDPLRKLKSNYDGNLDGMDSLFKEELNIENVDTISDIILSDEWIDFFNSLDVPVNSKVVGTIASNTKPQIKQVFIKSNSSSLSDKDFNLRLCIDVAPTECSENLIY